MEPEADDADLQSQVLQSTLDEVANRNDAQDQDVECCVICLDAVTKPCKLVPCGHRNFDLKCVALWLQGTKLCPLCKGDVTHVSHGDPLAKSTVEEITLPPYAPLPAPIEPQRVTSPHPQAALNSGGYQAYYARRRPRESELHRPRPRPPRNPTNHAVIQREEVYRNQRYSKHVGSNRLSRYRELTPQLFNNDTELVSRARMFIRRELQVFSFLQSDRTPSLRINNAEFLLEYIIAILKSVDIMGSGGQAAEMLSDFLGAENSRLFLHELRGWLRSPYTKLGDWDRAVQYDSGSGTRSREFEVDMTERVDPDTGGRTRGRTTNDRRERQQRKGDFYRPAGRGDGEDLNRDLNMRYRSSRHEPYGHRSSHTRH